MNLNEVPKSVINSVAEFPNEYTSKILKIALTVSQPTPAVDRSKIIEKFCNESGIPKEHIYEVLGIYIALVKLFLESNDKEFNERLHELGFNSAFIKNLPLASNRQEVINNFYNSSQTDFGKLHSLKWRIDISLSNSVLVKKIPTSVILCLNLKNGRKCTIEVDAKMFHKLRFNVALLLKELNSLKSNFLDK